MVFQWFSYVKPSCPELLHGLVPELVRLVPARRGGASAAQQGQPGDGDAEAKHPTGCATWDVPSEGVGEREMYHIYYLYYYIYMHIITYNIIMDYNIIMN